MPNLIGFDLFSWKRVFKTCAIVVSSNLHYHRGRWHRYHCQQYLPLIFLDENECATGNHKCTQLCRDSEGSYYCECHKGYRIGANRLTCEGKWKQIFLTFLFQFLFESELIHTVPRSYWVFNWKWFEACFIEKSQPLEPKVVAWNCWSHLENDLKLAFLTRRVTAVQMTDCFL